MFDRAREVSVAMVRVCTVNTEVLYHQSPLITKAFIEWAWGSVIPASSHYKLIDAVNFYWTKQDV